VGVWGIPLATSLVNVAGAVALAYALRTRLGRLGLGAILDSLVRIVAASGVAAGVAFLAWWGLDDTLGRSFATQIVSLGVALVVAGVAYLGVCRALRVPEINPLLALVRRGWARS
jgi:putative peptidoglycan lipid II flippase